MTIHRLIVFLLSGLCLLCAACAGCETQPVTPDAGGTGGVAGTGGAPATGGEAGAPNKTESEIACAHLSGIGCAEGDAVNCAGSIDHMLETREIDTGTRTCWILAKTKTDARQCGSLLCR